MHIEMTPTKWALVFFVLVIVAAAAGYAGVQVAPQVSAAETAYTYNIKGKIVSVTGVWFPGDPTKPADDPKSKPSFKYVVCADFARGVQPEVLSKNVDHVLPAISEGHHCLPIPDSDIVGYIDWEISRPIIANPVDSFGVKVVQYTLREGVTERLTTFSCHEELGSSGAAELVCSEF